MGSRRGVSSSVREAMMKAQFNYQQYAEELFGMSDVNARSFVRKTDGVSHI